MITQGVRVALPPLAALHRDSPVQVVTGSGQALAGATLGNLAGALRAAKARNAVYCLLHPADSLLASLALPPLAAARLTAAVNYGAQQLLLGAVEHCHLGHGPRGADGQVTVTWLARSDLARLTRLLADCKLRLAGLHPAPFGLALPQAGAPSQAVLDGYWLQRQGPHQAAVEPRLPDEPPATVASSLGGPLPAWGLHQCVTSPRAATGGWGRAVGCCALAILVWLGGVNLYARQLAAQGAAIKARMNAQVHQAFPAIGVVLNPLQQARQQLQAGGTEALQDPTRQFAALLGRAAEAMPFMAGAAQSLAYADGQLRLTLGEGYQAPATGDWQAQLLQQGVEATPSPGGWILRPLPSAAGDSAGAP